MITNLLAPGEQLLRANPMPPGNVGDDGAVLQALHHDPRLDVERPAATPPGPRDHLAALERVGPSVKRMVDLTVKSIPPHAAASSMIRRLRNRWGRQTAYADRACRAASHPPVCPRSSRTTIRNFVV